MPKDEKIIYFENLNALRGIAFTMVFVYHYFNYIGYKTNYTIECFLVDHFVLPGHLGVNLFFVLSGFLITYLLLVEKKTNGNINIPYFYARRLLRIWPLFYVVLIVSFFIFPILTSRYSTLLVTEHIGYFLIFCNNFHLINSHFFGTGADNLGILWSVAVEEQFYLFWPLLLFLIQKKYYPLLFGSVIAASLIFRALYVQDPTTLYFHTLSVMSDLAVGASLAYSAIFQTKLFNALVHCKRWAIVFFYVLFFFVICFYRNWSKLNNVTIINERLFLSLFFAFIIGEQCFSKNSLFKLGRSKIFSFLGIISYGLYCLHMYSIIIIQKFNAYLHITDVPKGIFFVELFVCLLLCLCIAVFSYNYFEKKILSYKINFVAA
jgi:peptidoglycan/LPS O-acetylase OafA/YrhL